MKKSTQLKNLINSEKTEFLMEAHSGLSAKIVEEAGFKGILCTQLYPFKQRHRFCENGR
jgi:phosphoenolpyruvate phosphomutase